MVLLKQRRPLLVPGPFRQTVGDVEHTHAVEDMAGRPEGVGHPGWFTEVEQGRDLQRGRADYSIRQLQRRNRDPWKEVEHLERGHEIKVGEAETIYRELVNHAELAAEADQADFIALVLE